MNQPKLGHRPLNFHASPTRIDKFDRVIASSALQIKTSYKELCTHEMQRKHNGIVVALHYPVINRVRTSPRYISSNFC